MQARASFTSTACPSTHPSTNGDLGRPRPTKTDSEASAPFFYQTFFRHIQPCPIAGACTQPSSPSRTPSSSKSLRPLPRSPPPLPPKRTTPTRSPIPPTVPWKPVRRPLRRPRQPNVMAAVKCVLLEIRSASFLFPHSPRTRDGSVSHP